MINMTKTFQLQAKLDQRDAIVTILMKMMIMTEMMTMMTETMMVMMTCSV